MGWREKLKRKSDENEIESDENKIESDEKNKTLLQQVYR